MRDITDEIILYILGVARRLPHVANRYRFSTTRVSILVEDGDEACSPLTLKTAGDLSKLFHVQRETDKDQQIEKWTGFAPGGVVWSFKSRKGGGEDTLVGTRCNLRGVKGQ